MEADSVVKVFVASSYTLIFSIQALTLYRFVSSRGEPDIYDALGKTANILVDAEQNSDDIEKFILEKVKDSIKRNKLLRGVHEAEREELCNEIVTTLNKKSNGM
jgi:hypothetical protein